jgi:hypothetical protein
LIPKRQAAPIQIAEMIPEIVARIAIAFIGVVVRLAIGNHISE